MSALLTGVSRIDGHAERTRIAGGAASAREPPRGMDRAHQACRAAGEISRSVVCTFWTSLENKPLTMLSGIFQKRRGVRSDLPDVLVVYRHATGIIVIFIELKSRRGVASKAQKQLRLEILPAGAVWWMARSARAAMMALHLSGVVFRRKWEPPAQPQPWEGPFADPAQRLPQHPKVAAERQEAKRRYRLRQTMRAGEAAKLAAERDAGDCIAA
jgi:hypothetical protein